MIVTRLFYQHVYGSEAIDYDRPHMMLAPVYSNHEQLASLSCKSNVLIGLICEPGEWSSRSQAREDPKKRLVEGVRSLTWLLDQGDEVAWVHNQTDRLDDTSLEITSIVKGKGEPDKKCRQLGEQLLRTLETMIK